MFPTPSFILTDISYMEDNTRQESPQQAQQSIDKSKQEKVVYRTARSCSLVNGLLVIFKLVAGILGMSLAMMADAVHSLSDYLTDLLILYRLRMERKPKNDEHDYGYGRVAVFAAGVTGIVLFILGIMLFYLAIQRMVLNFSDFSIPRPGMIALIAALVSIVVKAVIWLIVSRRGEAVSSELLMVRAWQHRNDALTSIGTTLGIAGAMFLGSKWRIMDPITCIIVFFFIMKIAWIFVKGSFYQLTDKSLPLDVESRIAEIARQEENVVDVYQVLTRRIGSNAAIELRIGIDGNTPLKEAYAHVQHIESRLMEEFGEGTHIGVRIEPAT